MTGFLIRGTKEINEGDVFHGHHFYQIPIWTGLRVASPCYILLHSSGVIQVTRHGKYLQLVPSLFSSNLYQWYNYYPLSQRFSITLCEENPFGRQSVDWTLITTSNVLA